jgi:hypothetical protein
VAVTYFNFFDSKLSLYYKFRYLFFLKKSELSFNNNNNEINVNDF